MKAYIIHGYSASPKSHWFEWLSKELNQLDIDVSILSLPDSSNPNVDEWQKTLKEEIKNIDENSYFITHSLGSITLLKFLVNLDIKKLGGFVLVSPFNKSLPILKQLDSFIEPNLDYDKLKKVTNNRTIIAAKDDVIVPIALSESLALSLDANFVSVEKGRHFLASDGFEKFPFLFEEFKKFIKGQDGK